MTYLYSMKLTDINRTYKYSIFYFNHSYSDPKDGQLILTFLSQVVFAPLFVVRNHLPVSLVMNIETPRLKSCQEIELEGQGRLEQLHTMSGDMTHNITFKLRFISCTAIILPRIYLKNITFNLLRRIRYLFYS